MYQDELLNTIVNPNWKNETLEAEKQQAFEDGFKKGLSAQDNAMRQYFASNVEKATGLAAELYQSFGAIDFHCLKLMLKPTDVDSFEFLFIVEENTYLSEKRKEVYKLIRTLKKQTNNQEFSFDCMLMPTNGEVTMERVLSEGYKFKYEPESRKA